jgi:hypothetical protein
MVSAGVKLMSSWVRRVQGEEAMLHKRYRVAHQNFSDALSHDIGDPVLIAHYTTAQARRP